VTLRFAGAGAGAGAEAVVGAGGVGLDFSLVRRWPAANPDIAKTAIKIITMFLTLLI
jgi:hypothetical protein